MNTDAVLQKISQFRSSDPVELGRQLSTFEDRVATILARIALRWLPVLKIGDVKTADCVAIVGEVTLTDSTGGDINVRLPAPAPAYKGRFLGVARRSAANTVSVVATEGNVNGASSDALSVAQRAFLFICDGSNWLGCG